MNPIHIAPMLECTDRHFRYLLRQISQQVLLYTEMITTGALLHGDYARLLAYDPVEHPVVIQLGGHSPHDLSVCAKMVEDEGYDEVNLNIGCPSSRVQSGAFGACLMAKPALVAKAVSAMQAAVSIPVTVKTRIGIDEHDSYEFLADFVRGISETGVKTVIIHARKAWLSGLSPKQNRTVPPLNYERVYQIKQDFPELHIILNGGINSFDALPTYLKQVDGVMLGRAIYQDPWLLDGIDERVYGHPSPRPSRFDVAELLLPYWLRSENEGLRFAGIARHWMGLFHGCPGAKVWRRTLSSLEPLEADEARPALAEFIRQFRDAFENAPESE